MDRGEALANFTLGCAGDRSDGDVGSRADAPDVEVEDLRVTGALDGLADAVA
jgi:hypothetical protein